MVGIRHPWSAFGWPARSWQYTDSTVATHHRPWRTLEGWLVQRLLLQHTHWSCMPRILSWFRSIRREIWSGCHHRRWLCNWTIAPKLHMAQDRPLSYRPQIRWRSCSHLIEILTECHRHKSQDTLPTVPIRRKAPHRRPGRRLHFRGMASTSHRGSSHDYPIHKSLSKRPRHPKFHTPLLVVKAEGLALALVMAWVMATSPMQHAPVELSAELSGCRSVPAKSLQWPQLLSCDLGRSSAGLPLRR